MNKAKCLVCGKVVESTYRHDYQTCGCDNMVSVDGGNVYCRYGFKDASKMDVWENGEWVNLGKKLAKQRKEHDKKD